jgi:hypothetical protein
MFSHSALVFKAAVTYWPMWNPAGTKSGLPHRDSATWEYYHGCFLDRGTNKPSPGRGPPGALTDENIPPHDDSPIAIQRPITRAPAHQLQYRVKSFLSSTPCQLQDRLLPNEILVIRNEGQAYEGLKNELGGAQGCGQGAGPETGRAQHDGGLRRDGSESYSDFRTNAASNWNPGRIRLRFWCSLYGSKDNDETFPTLLVSPPDSTWVIRNRWNKLDSRNCFGAMTPYGPIGPSTELSAPMTRH